MDANLYKELFAIENNNCFEIINKPGFGWIEQTLGCYVIVTEVHVFDNSMIERITPFTLLKQNHVLVRFAYENHLIPTDASAVVIAGFKLSELGKRNVGMYLNKGGSVYQLYCNDFKNELITKESETETTKPLI